MATEAIQEFEKLQAGSEFLFVLVYRGHWCPFCMSHIRSLVEIQPSIEASGGKTVLITAEMEEHLPKMRAKTGYEGVVIVDPPNSLVKELKARKVADVAISKQILHRYDHDMAQPAIAVVTRDGTVLYSWAIVPSVMNLAGAKDRPVLQEVWNNVQAKLEGKDAVDVSGSTQGVMEVIWDTIWPSRTGVKTA